MFQKPTDNKKTAASIGLNGLGFVQGSSSVLQIGCGNSNLGEQLHDSCGIGTPQPPHLANIFLVNAVPSHSDSGRLRQPT